VLVAPQFLAQGSYYSMNSFDLVFWALAALLVAKLARTGDARLWLPLGAVLGLGLLNKIGVLVFGVGLAAAVLLTSLRRHLLRRQLWLGALLAAVIFAPYVAWQARHDWATLEFIRNAAERKIAALTPWQFFTAQIPEIHPLNVLVWLPGLAWLLFDREGRRFRALGVIYVVALAVFALQRSKPYYLGPAYPMLLAAGAVALERWTTARVTWLRPALTGALAVTGALIAPLAVPVLPVETLIAYQRALGEAPSTQENQRLGPLSQFFADRFGWREMTAAVASAYAALPAEERAAALIVTSNYGEAGALAYHGRAYGLPRAVSQHNSFYLWGPGAGEPRVFIVVGASSEDLRESFDSVTVGARFESRYAMPYETREPIHVCRGLKLPLAEAWRRGRHYI
jgi:4-amino-4-deoxy-L-arabinose transferase-like glycosyltransferase